MFLVVTALFSFVPFTTEGNQVYHPRDLHSKWGSLPDQLTSFTNCHVNLEIRLNKRKIIPCCIYKPETEINSFYFNSKDYFCSFNFLSLSILIFDLLTILMGISSFIFHLYIFLFFFCNQTAMIFMLKTLSQN